MTTTTSLPLFYRELAIFNPEIHGKLKVPETPPNYLFARAANVIPLLINEIPFAIRHYPIVFVRGSDDELPALVAMVGVGDNVNRFVDAKGKWRPDTYIPAWVRRYPFLSVRVDGAQGSVLALDPTPDWLDAGNGEVLMGGDGNPTSRMQFIATFQNEFEALAQRTQTAVTALAEVGVLEDGSLRLQPPAGQSGEGTEVKGFSVVSEKKLRELSNADVWMLHKADALGVAYAHLLSLGSLGNVLSDSSLT